MDDTDLPGLHTLSSSGAGSTEHDATDKEPTKKIDDEAGMSQVVPKSQVSIVLVLNREIYLHMYFRCHVLTFFQCCVCFRISGLHSFFENLKNKCCP